MKKKNFFRHFVETLQARSLLGMLLLAPMGASAQVTIGSGDIPKTTLDIIGDTLNVHGEGFRLIDGNQAPNKVLTCQENGVGTWQNLQLPKGTDLEPYTAEDGWTITSQSLVYYGNLVTVRARFQRTGAPVTSTPSGGLIIGYIKSEYAPFENANVSSICPIMNSVATIIDNPGIVSSCLGDASLRLYFPTRMSITVNTDEIVFITLTFIHTPL